MRDDSRRALFIGFLTFILTIGIGTISNGLARQAGFIASLIVLFFMITIGILFDIIGVAATAGAERPFHAMASKKIPGARHGLRIVRNAHSVSTFSNDVIGDIVGTVSGALAMGLVVNLLAIYPKVDETMAITLLTAFVAALTVGGKAKGKAFAINRSTQILHFVGRILEFLERITGIELLKDNPKRYARKRKRRLKKF